jgi:hypothetical protein
MVIVNRQVGGRASTVASKGSASKTNPTSSGPAKGPSLSIPTSPSKPTGVLGKAKILIHGEEKIGKTTLASKFDDPLFLLFEPGGDWLTIKRLPEEGQFTRWSQFVTVVDNLERSADIQTIVIDTADLAYELCMAKILDDAGEDWINEGNLGYGKGFDKVDSEFKKQVLRITGTGRGVIFISHTKSSEFEEATGVKYIKLIPTMRDRARRFLKGFADLTGFYGYFSDDRYLVVQGNDNLDAGHRMDGRFLTPKGEAIQAIPMGKSPAEAYRNFVAAFNNKQTDPCLIRRKPALSEVKAKFKVKKG